MSRWTINELPAEFKQRPGSSNGRRQSVAHRGVARSLQFLRNHCSEPITVLDLTRVSGMSRRGFQKAFLQHIGCPPGRMLRQLRLQRARQLLARSRLNLKSIALKSGYLKPNSFWIAFRRDTGLPPRKFQDLVRLA